ncbi:phytoene desaturase family protein [Amycolatopsis sp. WGS_07]|uniref:phytoene desaturase family protein n=1 Tax=Amycolatopsis sp. WGS_07 TaxID=3076764 RepID=UPI003872FF8F
MSEEEIKDVIVVGAGLSGLTAAISLQQRGYSVLVLERRPVAGGLCGSTTIDGYQFTIGSNDFGSAIKRYLHQLGVDLEFEKNQTVFYCGREKYVLPATSRTVFDLIRHLPDTTRVGRALRNPEIGKKFDYVGQFLDATVRNKTFRDFLSLPSYVAGHSPATHRFDLFRQIYSKNPDYGYHELCAPTGGPQAITDSMTARFAELGGRIEFDTDVLDVRQTDDGKLVTTSRGTYRAKHLVSSEARTGSHSVRSSLEIGVLHLATRPDVPFPEGVHTVGYLPPGVQHWLGQLDDGQLPDQFGFHSFPCATTEEYRSFNVYFYYPRGVEEFDSDTLATVENYIINRLSTLIPGFGSRLLFRRSVSPAQFKKEHNLRRVSIEDILPLGVEKPAVYDAETDTYYVGNTVGAVAYHACAAMYSALDAADQLASANPRA